MSTRTKVTIELAKSPWFIESHFIDPAHSFRQWQAQALREITIDHPEADVRFALGQEVTREQGYRIRYDQAVIDKPNQLTLHSSIGAILHDLTMGTRWCVYLPARIGVADTPVRDVLEDDLDTGMERLKRDSEDYAEQEYGR